MTATRRRTRTSPLRIGLLAGLVGLGLLAAGVFAFVADQNSRREPFEIAPYPGADFWGTQGATSFSRTVFYKIADSSPEQVMEYYQRELSEHTGGDPMERCQRYPAEGDFLRTEVTGDYIPYYFACMFDRSNLNATQYTKVVIRPGTPHADPQYDTQGLTVVQYEQQWQP